MRQQIRHRASKTRKFYTLVIVACIFATFITLFVCGKEMRRLAIDRSITNQQISDEIALQQTLKNQEAYYESDAYIEKIAREKLGLIKPNDIIYIDKNN